jgi:pimeloyl-ACP methyl ester carboxylesterase
MPTQIAGDVELHYEDAGSGPPVVLIMGLGADANAWMLQVPEFAHRHRTIVFDNRGVGRSAKPPGPYTIRQLADDTARLMSGIGIDRAHVVGVSMGGMIAQELALNHPQRVGALVLACTYAAPGPEIEGIRASSFVFFGADASPTAEVVSQLSGLDPLAIFQHMLPVIFSDEFIAGGLLEIVPQLTAGLAYGFSIEALLGQVHACLTHDTTDRLHQIRHPTLVLHGTADRLVSPQHADALVDRIPGARFVGVEGGSHAVNLEMPEQFNAHVLEFLAAHPLDGWT